MESKQKEHQFDHVTRYCIFCWCPLITYFRERTECKRLMEPVEEELDEN